MKKIIQEDYIDEEATRAFLNDWYNGLDLLPNIPSRISNEIAANVLNVSMPTIGRMVQDGQIELTRRSLLLKYISDNMLCNRPVSWDDEEKSAAQEKKEPKNQSNIPRKKAGLFQWNEPKLPQIAPKRPNKPTTMPLYIRIFSQIF